MVVVVLLRLETVATPVHNQTGNELDAGRCRAKLAAAAASVVAAVAVLSLVRAAHFTGCEASKFGQELGPE